MIAYGAIPVWLAVVVLSREALVAGTVIVLASMGVARIDVSWTGKAATFGLMVCFPLLLLSHGPGSWTRGVADAAWVIVVPSLVLSFASAAGYYVPARDGLRARHAKNNAKKTAG
jgi:phosphatidylglycerophosphate synthase